MKLNIGKTLDELSKNVKHGATENAPIIFVVAGVTGLVAAGILASVKSAKAPKLAEEQQIRIEEIKAKKEDEVIDEKEYKKEISKAYGKCAWEWFKMYAPSVVLAGLSAGMIFESNSIMKKRNASLAAAYTTLQSAFDAYRKRVVEKYGKDEDQRLMTGAHEETIVKEVIDEETGKKKKVKEQINVLDPNDIENWQSYARIMGDMPKDSIHYCAGYCAADPDMSFNETQCIMAQNYMNDRLIANGWVTLNELYEELGFKKTKAGQNVGWVYNTENGDCYIDLRINNNFWYKDCDGNLCRGLLIDPNVQGYILDKVPCEEI